MKHAYLIIANRNPGQLQNLLNTIDDYRNDIYLLIDAKSTIIASKLVTRFSNLNVLKPINIYWGSYSQIQAEINLFKSASYGKYGYYHLISGLDLPLVNQDKIHDFFDSHPNHEFLTYSKANEKKQIQLRVKKHFFINQFRNNTEIMKLYRKIEKNILKVIPVSKRYVDNLGYASNWVTIDHKLVKKIIANEEKIYRLFHNGYLVDELFIPTVINFNPEFKNKIYYSIPVTDNPNEFQGNMRFINWWDGTPYIWKIQDYDKLKRARKMGHLFSRKFDETVDNKIIIKEKIMNYLVVGSGLFGSTFAHEIAKYGSHVTVIEKKDHIGGNIYTKEIDGIQVHQYGAHIFHTKSKEIWDYINHFADFNRYTNSPIANYHGEIYNLPFNMNTFHQMWGVITPSQALVEINKQREEMKGKTPRNLEEQAISLVGRDIYEKLIKGYTEKQWGRKAIDLPAFIIRRLPVRLAYNNNYFNDPYQGIPMGGYTQIIEKMLDNSNIKVKINTDFFDKKDSYIKNYDKIIFTGMIDRFFDYQLGELEYRSLKFETEELGIDNYQGNAVVNYTDSQTPFTRIIEHKYFEFSKGDKNKTIITHEYPQTWHRGDEPYYPINDRINNKKYKNYTQLAQSVPNVIFGGRLGQYRYYDMDQTIMASLQLVRIILENKE